MLIYTISKFENIFGMQEIRRLSSNLGALGLGRHATAQRIEQLQAEEFLALLLRNESRRMMKTLQITLAKFAIS